MHSLCRCEGNPLISTPYRVPASGTGHGICRRSITPACGLKVVSSIVVELIHLFCELHVCAVGTSVRLVEFVSQELTTIGEDQ